MSTIGGDDGKDEDPVDDGSQRDQQGRTQTGRALVLVVVVALVAVLVLSHTGSSVAGPARSLRAAAAARPTSTTAVAPSQESTTTVASIAPTDTTVEVLNGLEAGTLAGNLSGRLRADGYKTLAPENATTMTPVSAIYVVQPAYIGAADALASTLGLGAGTVQISRDLPSTAPVPAGAATGSDLIVVIGTSLQALASHPVAPPKVEVPTSTTTTTPSSSSSTTASSTTASSTTASSIIAASTTVPGSSTTTATTTTSTTAP